MLSVEWNMDDALAVSRAEGREEGISQGISQGMAQTARNFKNIGVSIDVISQATGLSAQEIQRL